MTGTFRKDSYGFTETQDLEGGCVELSVVLGFPVDGHDAAVLEESPCGRVFKHAVLGPVVQASLTWKCDGQDGGIDNHVVVGCGASEWGWRGDCQTTM